MLRDKLDEARVFLQMAEEEGGDDSEAARETAAALDTSRAELERQELRLMLSDMRQQLSEFDDRAEKLGRRL